MDCTARGIVLGIRPETGETEEAGETGEGMGHCCVYKKGTTNEGVSQLARNAICCYSGPNTEA